MKFSKHTVRWIVRLAILASVLFLVSGGPVPSYIARIVPGTSPFALYTIMITQNKWFMAAWWLLPPIGAIILAIFKGRLFCQWLCPSGTLYSLPTKISLKKHLLTKFRPNVIIFWLIITAAAVGAPCAMFLDPLVTFSRITPAVGKTYTIASLIPGLFLPVVMLFSLIQPMIWCTHFCPLGYFFDFAHGITHQPKKLFIHTRRQILAGIVLGVPAALVVRKLGFKKSAPTPILPPGAGDTETFATRCTRCYACVNVCKGKVIKPCAPGTNSMPQWFQPELKIYDAKKIVKDKENKDVEKIDLSVGYCKEDCNACAQACPSGAIAPLMLEEKRNVQIAIALIDQKKCIQCRECWKRCPYGAVEEREEDMLSAFYIISEKCRGCGLCRNACPVKGKAITITGVATQKFIV